MWNCLTTVQRRLVITGIGLGLLQLATADLYFRLQELPEINQYLAGQPLAQSFIDDGIQYPLMVASALICMVLMAASVAYASSKSRGKTNVELSWLGSAWLIAGTVLVLDLLIDTFEVKWPVIVLFVYTGVRYWKGARKSVLGLTLAPTVVVIAALDGLHHASGQDCVATGLDSCPGKAVSDIYLVIALLVLTFLTIQPFLDRRTPDA